MRQNFAKNFIKGRIGEVIFDQMFREEGDFVVIPFGYERMIPEFTQYASSSDHKEVIDNIRNAPDFALVSQDKKEVFLIEVKYRSNIYIEELVKTAEKIEERWKLVWMFICTPSGFYFNKTTSIIKEKRITRLEENMISIERQEKYLKLLNEFIKSN